MTYENNTVPVKQKRIFRYNKNACYTLHDLYAAYKQGALVKLSAETISEAERETRRDFSQWAAKKYHL